MIDIPHDKLLHFNGGLLIAIVVSILLNPLAGFIAGSIIGILKEIRDSFGFGTPDYMDAIATSLGAFIPLLLVLL